MMPCHLWGRLAVRLPAVRQTPCPGTAPSVGWVISYWGLGPSRAGTDHFARRIEPFFLLVAALAVVAGVGLSVSLHFPEVLLDDRSFVSSLVDSHAIALVLGLLA